MPLNLLRPPSTGHATKVVDPADTAPKKDTSLDWGIVFFFIAHIPLAFLLDSIPITVTIYAWATLALGFFSLLKDKEPYRVIYVMGYIVSAELLWRGRQAAIFWEAGKIFITLYLLLLILKYRKRIKIDLLPVLYIGLLASTLIQSIRLPESLAPLAGMNIYEYPFYLSGIDREDITYYLGGPILLATASVYFYSVKLDETRLRNLLLSMIAPAVTLGALAVLGIATSNEFMMTGSSNEATSANIGPNQVSSILSLGSFAALLVAGLSRKNRLQMAGMLLVSLWLFGQALLTFSRGGVYTTIGAAAVGVFFMARDRRARRFVFLGSAFVFIILNYWLFPALDQFSLEHGSTAVTDRLQDMDTTGRLDIIRAELAVFASHPISGVGIGEAKYQPEYIALAGRSHENHTEYTRMLSEHGVYGAAALVLLLAICIFRVTRKIPPLSKALAIAFTVWALLFMAHSATRNAAQGFIFGLGSAIFQIHDQVSAERKLHP